MIENSRLQAVSLVNEYPADIIGSSKDADKVCDADVLIAVLKGSNNMHIIPKKSNRAVPCKTNFARYRERNLIEKFLIDSKIRCYSNPI